MAGGMVNGKETMVLPGAVGCRRVNAERTVFSTMKKGASCGCLGDLLGMKSYPVIWGLQ